MIQMQTNLEVADNSGARRCNTSKCSAAQEVASVGDVIVVSVKEAIPRGRVKKASAPGCRCPDGQRNSAGRWQAIRFDSNAAVLINQTNEPIGTRIFGPVTRAEEQELYEDHFSAPEVL